MNTGLQFQIGISNNIQSLLRGFRFCLGSLGDARREDGECQPLDGDLKKMSGSSDGDKLASTWPTSKVF